MKKTIVASYKHIQHATSPELLLTVFNTDYSIQLVVAAGYKASEMSL